MSFTFSQRRKEVLYTVISNISLQFVTAVCGFILPPLIIGTFGSAVNGMVASISQFIAYLNIVEAGVGGAAIAALYKPLTNGNSKERNGILSATAKFYNRSGILFTILIFVLAFVYPFLVENEVDKVQSGLMVLILGITGVAEFFLIGKYRVLLIADKKLYVISVIQMIAIILNTIIAVILIKLSFDILIVKFISAVIYLCRYFFISIYVHNRYIDIDFHTTPDTKAIEQSKNVLVHKITALVISYSPLVLITIYLTLKDASIYAVYAMVFSAIGNLLYAFGNGAQSFIGQSLASESKNQTLRLFEIYETLFIVMTGFVYTLSYVLIIPFMKLYTVNMTDANYIQRELAFLFVIIGIITYVRDPSCQSISAAGHFRQSQWMTICEMLINLIFSILFILKFGLKGILLGSVLSYCFRLVTDVFYTAKKILYRNPFRTFIKLIVSVIYFSSFAYFIEQKTDLITSYGTWVLYALVSGLIVSLPLLIVFFVARRRYV